MVARRTTLTDVHRRHNQLASWRVHLQYCALLLVLAVLLSTPAEAVNCPLNCKCYWVLDSLEVDCSYSGLLEYPNLEDIPVEHLDLSGNHFAQFPLQYADIDSLIYLDLSDNKIDYLEADALLGFTALRTLLLANNSITSWESLNPNEVFQHAVSLKRLSLSGNKLESFSNVYPQRLIQSGTINHLELERCGIVSVTGDHLITLMPNLERLALSGNAIVEIGPLPSYSLRELELSNCNLKWLNPYLLEALPSLELLNLSHNAALQIGGPTQSDIAKSDSITSLDLSFCNMDAINLSGLLNLRTVVLRGNMLRLVNAKMFANNTMLEQIDLSRNSLRLIESDAFMKLKRLTTLDLSYNEIARLDRSLFRSNDALISLNLSRNIIEKFTKLLSNSLRDINLSWCEIITVEGTALSGLTSINRLDLSNNLIKTLPNALSSETLRTLDLSNCRLLAIKNNTFRGFTELASLRLNGNRFTSPFPAQYFQSNKFLDEIWIGDNPWICNCHDTIYIDFYDYLTAKPQKLKDKANVRCASPTALYGQTWESACAVFWSKTANTSGPERVWTALMLTILVLVIALILFKCFQKSMKNCKQRQNHREYRQNHDEMMEIRRQNERMLQQEGTPNAPSAIETNLPSYEDALRMPKPVRPVKSMADLLGSSGRDRTTVADAEHEGLVLDNTHRFRSEEMLSNRAKERTAQIGPHRRTGRVEYNNSGSRRFSIEDSRFPAAHVKSQNLQSAEKIGNFQSYENSPYTKRKPKIAEIPPFKRATLRAESVEFLTDNEFEATNSPFARRKPKLNTPTQTPTEEAASYANLLHDARLEPAIEDYFGAAAKQKSGSGSGSGSMDGSDFHVVIEPDVTSLRSSNGSSSPAAEIYPEPGKRKKRKNSSCRRASGNFNAAAAAAGDSSSSEKEPIVVVHKPMRETLF